MWTWTQAQWQLSRPNKGSFPLLTVETAFLIYSILSLERAMRGRSYFFPQVEGWGEKGGDSVGRRLGGQSLTDIFRDMGIKQALSGAGNNFVLIPVLKGKWVVERKGPGGGRAWQGQHLTPGKRRNQQS